MRPLANQPVKRARKQGGVEVTSRCITPANQRVNGSFGVTRTRSGGTARGSRRSVNRMSLKVLRLGFFGRSSSSRRNGSAQRSVQRSSDSELPSFPAIFLIDYFLFPRIKDDAAPPIAPAVAPRIVQNLGTRVQVDAESDAAIRDNQLTRDFRRSFSQTASFPPRYRRSSTFTKDLVMPTSYPGSPGPSGSGGQPHTPGQPVSGSHAAPEPGLMRSEQQLQEQLILNQIRRLTVRLLVDMFNLRIDGLFGDISTPLKPAWSYTMYGFIPLTNGPPNGSVGTICDKGKGQKTD